MRALRTLCLPARRAARLLGVAAIAAVVVTAPAGAGPGARNGVIIFSSARQGALEIFSMRADGSASRRLTTGQPFVSAASWSPDGKRLALFTEGGIVPDELWLMQRDGSGLRRVTGAVVAHDGPPTWSPDGRRLAFACSTGPWADSPQPICVVRADGAQRRFVTGSRRGQEDSSPTWSPDGKQIAFARSWQGNSDLHAVNLRTGKSHGLTSTRRDLEWSPSWSRHGPIAYAYAKALGGDNYAKADLYVMRGNGSAKRRVTRTAKIDEGQISWSPDARAIAYERSGSVYVSNRDGTKTHRLLPTPQLAYRPAWSPDGRTIAFVDAETHWLWLVNRDGTGAVPLLRGSQASTPAVTPDGSTVAFSFQDASAYDDSGCRACFFLMNVDGSNVRVARGGSHPSWSPDGRRVAVEDNDGIWAVNVDGSGGEWYAPPEHTSWQEPAWSPSGDSMAVSQFASESRVIYLISLQGDATPLTAGASPAWSPDGKRIAFVRGSTIRIVNSSNGLGERKVVANGFDPAWSPDGTKIVFVRYLGENSEIFVVNVNGTGLKRLTHNRSPDRQPAWQALR